MAAVTKEYVDSEIKNLESRTDAKFERLIGEMNTEFEKLRGEMNTGFEKLRGEMNAGFEKQSKEIQSQRTWVLGILLGLGMAVIGIMSRGIIW